MNTTNHLVYKTILGIMCNTYEINNKYAFSARSKTSDIDVITRGKNVPKYKIIIYILAIHTLEFIDRIR